MIQPERSLTLCAAPPRLCSRVAAPDASVIAATQAKMREAGVTNDDLRVAVQYVTTPIVFIGSVSLFCFIFYIYLLRR